MEVTEKSDNQKDKSGPADFEKAISAAGFGFFNVFLLTVATLASFASNFETSTMSFILPIAECDLKLTLIDKGTLNAATYAGMIVSALIWGYLADTQGRKKILVYGYLADAICVLCSSLSQNLQMLVAFKFLGGFFVNGPGAVLYTYLTELHGVKHRAPVLMLTGMMMSLANLVLPLLAWGIFPRDWNFMLFNSLRVRSWQIFLAISGIPSLISGLCFVLLPETPKFLMSQGRNMQALRSFQKIYAFNTKLPRDTYPITELIEEVPTRESSPGEVIYTIDAPTKKPKIIREHRTFSQALREGLQQMKPMFRKPLLGRSLHVYLMQFCVLNGLNTIRLWLPQLFASIAEYEALDTNPDGSANMCAILEFSVNKTASTASNNTIDCESIPKVSMDLYMSNIIVALTGFGGYFLAGVIVRALGAKRIMSYGLLISSCLGMGLYWSSSGLSTLILSSLFITVASISTSSLLGLVVALFPTTLRTIIIALVMMFGRLGALSGNMLFPVLVQLGCVPPFIMVGCVMFCAGILSFMLPSGKKTQFT